jgi:hypothetical protein
LVTIHTGDMPADDLRKRAEQAAAPYRDSERSADRYASGRLMSE